MPGTDSMNSTRLDHLRDKIIPVLEPYGIKRVGLFGSIARGEETPESDVDILVRFTKPIGLFKWVALEEELSARLGRKADLVSERGLSKYIRPYVEKEKIILYERRPRLHSSHSRRHKPNSKIRQNLTYAKFLRSQITKDAVIRQVTIIGEASRRLSLDFQMNHPQIPWSEVIGMRNRSVHDHLGTDFGEVWRVAQEDLPTLKKQLKQILRDARQDSP